jgi:pimeloyl-ACP methyl ester carboxylesterase
MEKVFVLLHGWQRDRADWINFEKELSSKYEVISWDLPGFGKEPLIDDNWSIPEYANWVNEKINKKLSNKKIVLLGHSFGGRVASYLASSQPSYLSALILYATPSLYRPTTQIKRKIGVYKILKRILPQSFLQSFKSDDQKNVENTSLAKIFRKTIPFDQTEELKKINVPTYIIQGDKDASVRIEIANEMHELIANSKEVIVPNATHFLHLENPILFNGIIKKIISEIYEND